MMPVAASEGDEVTLRDAAAVATCPFCSRPTDGAAPLKPGDAVRWMLAASLPPTPVHRGAQCTEERCNTAGLWGSHSRKSSKATKNLIKKNIH